MPVRLRIILGDWDSKEEAFKEDFVYLLVAVDASLVYRRMYAD